MSLMNKTTYIHYIQHALKTQLCCDEEIVTIRLCVIYYLE